MTFYRIIKAIPSIQNLVSQPLPLPASYKLYKLSVRINEEMNFCSQKENEIRDMRDEIGDERMKEELNELFLTESDLLVDPIEVKLDPNLKLSATDIGNLDGFVEFVE